ncbi:NUDIX domain-containing protein [Sphingobium sp.]|uniref:NUDIX domain-containing protein n=1 Tax=Sphingobium sp. TaxID=1912891 RepID=UPI002C5DF681|nr:ADP-ribose pyrophosphatase [Sphingobium sp.]HUD95312.1 ADP-ribose pyrophosphatase [Sphingobium sp.]
MSVAQIVGDDIVYDGWYRLRRLRVRMPCGTEVERHLEDHGSAAAVLPYDPVARTALIVSMPRAPLLAAGASPIWEAVAGTLDGREAEDCARAEAVEEAGVLLRALEPVACVWTMPALSSERLHLFLAPYAATDRIGKGGGAEGEMENITVAEIRLSTLRRQLFAGECVDPKLIMLSQALLLRRPELFV